MRFSQRIGINPAEKIIQIDSMDMDLRNRLWNALTLQYWETFDRTHGRQDKRRTDMENLMTLLWLNFFKEPIDDMGYNWVDYFGTIRKSFFDFKWWKVYDFIEFIAENGDPYKKEKFIKMCNSFLQEENSAYRFVDGKIAPITSPEEIESIESAIKKATPFGGVKEHLKSAISLFSDKHNPDYRNSMKESISAVESLSKQIAKDEKATLGVILNRFEKEGRLHPALKNAFSSLYGYTNDANGIRHALIEKESLTKSDARFMLICCSAFVNYVIETNL